MGDKAFIERDQPALLEKTERESSRDMDGTEAVEASLLHLRKIVKTF